MAEYDFNAPRLFIDAPLRDGAQVALDRGQANYLLNVLRLKAGETVLVFNGRDGEWRAEVVGGGPQGRRSPLRASGSGSRTGRPTSSMPSRPLKHARLDYMVQKAVEMGAGVLQPVLTRRTQSTRVNLERMRSNAIEAAEQCGILSIPEVREEENLERFLKGLEPERLVVFCDEDAPVSNPVEALAKLGNKGSRLGRYRGTRRRVHRSGESACRRPRKMCSRIVGTANPAS